MSKGSYRDSYDEDLFLRPDDVMSYHIDVSDSETESWGKECGCNRESPPDLEQLYWEEAKKKEYKYLELLSQEYGESNEVYKALDVLQNMPNDDDMEDAIIYHKHRKVKGKLRTKISSIGIL